MSIDDVMYSKAQLINSLDLNEYHEHIDRIRSTYTDINQKNKEIIANIEEIINSIDNNISKILETKAVVTNDPFKEGTIWRTDWWEYTGEYYIFSNEHGWVHHIEKEEKGLLTNDIKN